ncbi:hypothetical protein [Candidatus Odyssella acanthamoebae]|uniref:Uncharacterized protein n=1 Tax=Candidatus Odyssella acanthamoebae TaxID=91604 RepID=A0A077AVT3_9PROT|nr:hypothetical protein [Candidatus Paracaedibacter acanthamoebae]AIK96496.1 hypothetical protein ID47_06680 [Candidatus Paracaedibacter acanthamoebae]
MTPLPYCFFPTTILCIGKTYQQNQFLRDQSVASYKHCATPQTALAYLKKADRSAILFDRVVHQEQDLFDVSSINYLYEEIYNPRRYETVSCIIYRNKLPDPAELSFFEAMEDFPAKKILVTEDRDEKTIVTAFNQGLINFYVCTQDPDASTLLKEFIQQSQKDYFQSTVNAIINPILEDWQKDNGNLNVLLDPGFMEYFHTFIKNGNFTEYYLLDVTGSFLFLDAQGKASVLFVFDEQSFADQCQTVEHFVRSNYSLSMNLIEDLKQQRQTICFPFIYRQEFDHFERYIEPVQILEGQQRYYMAHSKGIDYLNDLIVLDRRQSS